MRWFAKKHRFSGMWSLACVMALALINGHAVGQCELDKLLASDGAVGDRFGFSVSITGAPGSEVAIVGAYLDDAPIGDEGSAYIYRRSGAIWVEEQKLLASDGATGDIFGVSVAISGAPGNEVAIVGSAFHADNGSFSGAAYIYRFNGVSWVEEQKLLASDGAAFEQFGSSVSIISTPGNDVAIVGAWPGDGLVAFSGSAYIYRFNGVIWVEEQKLLASDGATDDQFGWSVSIGGTPGNEVAIVGASSGDGLVADSGSAYIYGFNGTSWVEEAELLASDGELFDFFGQSVSLSGAPGNEVAIVGADGDDDNGSNSGSAYIYRFNGVNWVEETKLLASGGTTGDFFGRSVSLSGAPGNEVAIVGASSGDGLVVDSGSAYIYRFNGVNWVEETKLLAPDGAAADQFGHSVSISGDIALVGAWQDDDSGSNSGSAYIYGGLSDCNGNGVLDCLDLSAGTSSDFNGNFVTDECELLAYNQTAATLHGTIAEAIFASSSGHTLIASPLNFEAEPGIDFLGRTIILRSMTDISQAGGGIYKLSQGSQLETSPANSITIMGELRANASATTDVLTGTLTIDPGGQLNCRASSFLAVTAPLVQLGGFTRVFDLATLAFSGSVGQNGDLTVFPGATLTANESFVNGGTMLLLSSTMFGSAVSTNGTLSISSATVYALGLTVDAGGRLNTSGSIFSDITNNQDVFCLGDTLVVGDYLNNVLTTVQVGTLTIVGNLTNNGTILGNISAPPPSAKTAGAVAQTGDGMSISGHYTAGAATSLMMPDAIWVFGVGGNFDVAINDNTNYDMRLAQLRLDGLSGADQNLEMMSLDIGAESTGLDRSLAGHYPIGTLRIGPNATTVNLVDNHDNANDGQLVCEALYVETLIVNAGATLNTNGCRVYYETLQLDGIVDDPLNLIALPLCLADVNDDSSVNVTDLLSLLAAWGPCGAPCPPDINTDGNVNVTDLLALLAAWGACP